MQLDLSEAQKQYDRKLIDDGFKDFENDNTIIEAEIKN